MKVGIAGLERERNASLNGSDRVLDRPRAAEAKPDQRGFVLLCRHGDRGQQRMKRKPALKGNQSAKVHHAHMPLQPGHLVVQVFTRSMVRKQRGGGRRGARKKDVGQCVRRTFVDKAPRRRKLHRIDSRWTIRIGIQIPARELSYRHLLRRHRVASLAREKAM